MEYLQSEIKRREILMPHVMGKTLTKKLNPALSMIVFAKPGC